MRRDEDRAGEGRRSVKAEDEPHLIEEIAADPGGDELRQVAPAERHPLASREPENGQRHRQHRGEPDAGERHRVDVVPGDLEESQRGIKTARYLSVIHYDWPAPD